MIEDDEVIEFTVSIAGESGTGKTSLIYRYITNSFEDQSQTIGYNIIPETFVQLKKRYVVHYIDPSGNPFYDTTTAPLFRNSHIIVFVIDYSEQSYKYIETWYEKLCPNLRKSNVIFYLALNKSDLKPENSAEIFNQVQIRADGYKMRLRQVSAKDGSGVEEMFADIRKDLCAHFQSLRTLSVRLSSGRHSSRLSLRPKSSCC